MKKSCGFLIQCEDKFLLCHSTKPSGNINLSDGQWGIPKGGLEEGETEIQAALRETLEETGLDLSLFNYSNKPIQIYSTKSKKYVIFYCNIPDNRIFDYKLVCESKIEDTNKPENDGFIWVNWNTANEIAIKNQKFNLFNNEVKNKILQLGG